MVTVLPIPALFTISVDGGVKSSASTGQSSRSFKVSRVRGLGGGDNTNSSSGTLEEYRYIPSINPPTRTEERIIITTPDWLPGFGLEGSGDENHHDLNVLITLFTTPIKGSKRIIRKLDKVLEIVHM